MLTLLHLLRAPDEENGPSPSTGASDEENEGDHINAFVLFVAFVPASSVFKPNLSIYEPGTVSLSFLCSLLATNARVSRGRCDTW